MSLSWNNWFSSANLSKRFGNNLALFEGLKNADNAAILYLQIKALPSVKYIVKGYGLPVEQVDEVLNQSTLTMLGKIRDGSYVFQNNSPTTYLIEIARRVALMATRTRKQRPTESLDQHQDLPDDSWKQQLDRQEAAEQVASLLGQIGPPCNGLIRLKYIDGFSDEEIINRQLTKYSTIDSLKAKRSDCMKKLTQIALAKTS